MSAPILPDPSDPNARSKAFAIRRKLPKGLALPGEAEWIRDAAKTLPSKKPAKKATEANAFTEETAPPDPPTTFETGSSRKVMHIEETREATRASGDPAVMAAAMAAASAREEGRRYDYLLDAAVGSQRYVIKVLLERNGALEKAQIAMMETIREQYEARAQAEINTMFAAADAKKAAAEAAEDNATDEDKAMKLMQQLHAMMPMIQGFMGRGAPPVTPKP